MINLYSIFITWRRRLFLFVPRIIAEIIFIGIFLFLGIISNFLFTIPTLPALLSLPTPLLSIC